jgi:hypothetical protein
LPKLSQFAFLIKVFEKYYAVKYDCNTCGSSEMQQELQVYEALCNADCRQNAVKCIHQRFEWGGYFEKTGTVYGDYVCGNKDSSLPGCAVSSSSVGEDEQSSSSQELLSSDSQYSSFEAESSSSSDDGDDPGSSSGIGEKGIQCYIGDEESCHPWSDEILFKKRPIMLGDIRLYYHKPYCQENGDIVFRANIPIVYFRAASWLCLKNDCISHHSIEGYWECNQGSVQNNGCAAEPEHRSIPFYYSVMTRKLRTSWGTVDFSSTPESGMNLAYFDVNELLSIVAREGVYVDGDDGFSYDLTDLYPQFSKNSFDDYVRACAYHLNVDVSSSSEVGSSSSSSSLFVLASSSSVQSSSSEESSSSVEESSSSYECSSSDCGDDISSSSQEEFSSSSDELVSSGSVDVEESSSSQQMESSSSEFVYSSSSDGHFVSGGDQVHSPDQIFNDGLDNMEPGSCYSLNPDRGTQYGWMNTDAKDSWWWREVDCESGEKVDRNRVGVCPGFPLDKVPSNPKRSCVAYDGRCYRCKSENSYVDCSQEWLWKWTFNVQNIGSWYAEVDCYNPFEDDDVEECYEIDLSDDGIALLKRTEKDVVKFANLAENDIVNLNSTNYYYDVLGRNLRYHTNLNLEQPIYAKRNSKTLNILSKTTTLSGYVKGTPRMNICIKKDKVEGVVKYLNIKGSLRIVVGKLHYQGNDERLIAHEKEHKKIWSDEKYKKSWNYVATVTTSQSIYEACLTAFERLWGMEVQDLLIDVYTRQNNWDDDDENNSCESRIDINHDLAENKAKLLSGACSGYRGK